jgi:tetratricopeptide (TPR) repeat protein
LADFVGQSNGYIVNLFDRLFARKPAPESPCPDTYRTTPTPQREIEDPVTPEGDVRNPFDKISEALQAWHLGDALLAEKLFEQGIAEYTRLKPEGLDFALGRYGAFLLDQNRKDDAARVLELAIERNTEIPATWSDYLGLMADRGDLEGFKRSVERMATSVKHRIEPEFVLRYARRADRESAPVFAEAVARWVVQRSETEGDKDGRWAAIGDLGRILERTGRLDEALKLWSDAFGEGSRNPDTAIRLAMHLERGKDYVAAGEMIREALGRALSADVEELLRKRLARCDVKSGNKNFKKPHTRTDVSAYSVRRQSSLFEPMFQIRFTSVINHMELVGQNARCLLTPKESSTLVDIALATGSETRRVENLPQFQNARFAPDGQGIGVQRTAPVGNGPTLLAFLTIDGHVAAEASVPDATSEIALGPDLWYVGCRDGCLYAFGFDGKQRWAWETPGSKGFEGGAYFRPCPYFVTSRRSFATVASMGDIYAVSSTGKTVWHAEIPNSQQTRWEFTIPIKGNLGSRESYQVLGLPPDAPPNDVKSAYRRLALETHPDRNPGDDDAAARFRLVQGAYERILVGPATTEGAAAITVSFGFQGGGPTATFLAASAAGVFVGSSQGRLYEFDRYGALHQARVLGDGAMRATLRPDGTVGAAWCNGALLFFKDNKIINALETLDRPDGLMMLGDEVVSWRRKVMQVMDSFGRLQWSVEFSRTISGVSTSGDTLVCAAGVLTAFRRRRDG